MSSTDILRMRHRIRWALILRGLFAFAAGLYIIVRPIESVAILALVLAIWLLVDGFVHIVHAFDLRRVAPQWWVMLVNGIIGVAFGVGGLYFYPVLSLAYAVIWTGLWLLLSGGAAALVAVQARRERLSWAPMMAFALLFMLAGVLAFLRPGITLAALIALLAIVGIVGGVALLVSAARNRSAREEPDVPLAYRPWPRERF